MGKAFSKFIMYAILIMVAIGFTIPAFFDDQPQQGSSNKICQSDADCYLVCEDVPQAVMCHQNLCLSDYCSEGSDYKTAEMKVNLLITVEDEVINLKEQFEKINLNNFFVEFTEDSFTALAPDLNLNHVLDKLRMELDSSCLAIEKENYCGKLEMIVNGEPNYDFGNYFFADGDNITITYI